MALIQQLRSSLTLLLLLPALHAFCQPLDTLLGLLPEANPELRALQLEYQAALQVAPQAAQLPDPELRLGWFTRSPETRLGPQRLWWVFNQQLPWPGKLEARRQLAVATAAPLLEKAVARQLVLEQQLKKAWLELYRLAKWQEEIAEHLDIYQSWEQIALRRVESGQSGSMEVYQLQLEIRELRQRDRLLEMEKAKPQADINRLLGRPSNATVVMAGFLGIPGLPPNLDELLTRISTDHPAFRMLELQQEISRRTLALNQLERRPDVTLGLDYIIVGRRTDADPAGNGRDILMPHVGVKVPLGQEKYRAKEQEERLKVAALNQRLLDQVNTFQALVETALAEFRRGQSEISFIDEQVYLVRTMLRVAESDYASGRRPFDDLLELHHKLVEYQERHLSAVVAMHTALADLQLYLLF